MVWDLTKNVKKIQFGQASRIKILGDQHKHFSCHYKMALDRNSRGYGWRFYGPGGVGIWDLYDVSHELNETTIISNSTTNPVKSLTLKNVYKQFNHQATS